jgi:hypothetical protein
VSAGARPRVLPCGLSSGFIPGIRFNKFRSAFVGTPLRPYNHFMSKVTFLIASGLLLLYAIPLCSADCISIHEAVKHVGEVKCVTGKVLRVRIGDEGVHVLDFCQDANACRFTVVVFPSDLEDVGDVRQLEGRTIEIHGTVKNFDGDAEIIFRRISQLRSGMSLIPPLPKNYDVEERGHYSAGRFHPSKKLKHARQKPSTTAIYGNDVEDDESSD